MIPIAQLFPPIIAIPFLAVAGYYDIKSREIPDWLSYSFILTGALLAVIFASIYSSWLYLTNAIIAFVVCLIIGLAFYYLRFWGGGDSKLLFGMGFFFGNLELLLVAVSILFALTLHLFFALSLIGFEHKKLLAVAFKRESIIKKNAFYILIILFVLSILLLIFVNKLAGYILLAMVFFIYLFLFMYRGTKIIEKAVLIRSVSAENLREEDWPAEDIKLKDRTISKRCLGLTRGDIKQIRAEGIKSVLVKIGVPFAPAFFLFALAVCTLGFIL